MFRRSSDKSRVPSDKLNMGQSLLRDVLPAVSKREHKYIVTHRGNCRRWLFSASKEFEIG